MTESVTKPEKAATKMAEKTEKVKKEPAKKASAGAKRGPKNMTEAHKEALAAGREEGRIVRAYMEVLETSRPKRGRKRTPESITARLATLEERIAESSTFEALGLIQERIELTEALAQLEGEVEISEYEEAFVGIAKSYAERRGITYTAWREAGVDAAVLKRAGITRGAV